MRIKNRIKKAFSQNSRDESLKTRGIDGTAVVSSVKKSLVSTGDDGSSGERIWKYELRVTVPGREPYDVSHSETGHAEEGQTLPVKVDPDDPENLIIDWRAAKAETTSQWTQATQANEARVQQMFTPPAADAGGAALEPIEGISLERYAELSAARVKQAISTQEQQDAWLATQGVDPAAWQAAADGWGQRMAAQPGLAVQYAQAFQRAGQLTGMDLRPIGAGVIVGHEMKVDGEKRLVVEGPDGQAYGSIGTNSDGTVLAAADGSWSVPHIQSFGEKHRAVLDASGTEVAGIDYVHSSRELQLPGGALTWERKTMRPQYRIEGLFAVSRTALHSFVAGISRTPFKGDITDALVGRPDASLVLLVACWLTMGSIDSKVAASATSA